VGIENQVVDSSSIETNRRKRRAKTDRIDGVKLLTMLMRYWVVRWRRSGVPWRKARKSRLRQGIGRVCNGAHS
jgi:transposase